MKGYPIESNSVSNSTKPNKAHTVTWNIVYGHIFFIRAIGPSRYPNIRPAILARGRRKFQDNSRFLASRYDTFQYFTLIYRHYLCRAFFWGKQIVYIVPLLVLGADLLLCLRALRSIRAAVGLWCFESYFGMRFFYLVSKFGADESRVMVFS